MGILVDVNLKEKMEKTILKLLQKLIRTPSVSVENITKEVEQLTKN